MTFNPTDPEPVYYEDLRAYVVNVPNGRVDFTMREVLREIRQAPNEKR